MLDDEPLVSTGIKLLVGDGSSPEQFVEVAELLTIKPPALSRNEIDTSGVARDEDSKLLGILRRGQVTGMMNWLPTDPTHDTLIEDILANRKRNYRIAVPPDGYPRMDFSARLQLFDFQELAVDTPIQVAYALTIAKGSIVFVKQPS